MRLVADFSATIRCQTETRKIGFFDSLPAGWIMVKDFISFRAVNLHVLLVDSNLAVGQNAIFFSTESGVVLYTHSLLVEPGN